jgi:hypothetical protein
MPWLSRAIQLAGQGKIGIPTQGNLASMRTDQLDGPIYPRHAPFMTDHIARPINQIEHLSSISQRNNQRRITPDPFVGKSNASFALSKRPSYGAIGINKGVGKKASGLLFPDPLPSAVDGFHQIHNGLLVKAPGEISAGCRIRNALGAQAIQECFIVTTQLNIFQPLAIQKRIVG